MNSLPQSIQNRYEFGDLRDNYSAYERTCHLMANSDSGSMAHHEGIQILSALEQHILCTDDEASRRTLLPLVRSMLARHTACGDEDQAGAMPSTEQATASAGNPTRPWRRLQACLDDLLRGGTSSNPYCAFRSDRERRIALIARDVRITSIAGLMCGVGMLGSPVVPAPRSLAVAAPSEALAHARAHPPHAPAPARAPLSGIEP